MSNHLAIATVTAALGALLDTAVQADVPGAEVRTLRPGALGNGSSAPPIVNAFLYQATPNAAWRNRDLPTRDASGRVTNRPQAALDLHYLLTFSGNDTELEPQRLLGSAVRALEERPVLSRDAIRDTIATAPFSAFLAGSDLAEDVELVRFTPTTLNLEELSKLWSVFLQAPYLLSVTYLATVVLIEGTATPRAALPVAGRNVYAVPLRHPLIQAVEADGGPDEPILAGSTLRVRGRRLRGDVTRVLIGEVELTPAAGEVADTVITVALPADLPAGMHGLRVAHLLDIGTPPTPHRGVESNVAAFVLRPQIARTPSNDYDITVADRVETDGAVSATVTVRLVPEVERRQRVALVLDERAAPADRPPSSYRFDVPPRPPEAPERSATVAVVVEGVRPAEYLVRVRVADAESVLDQDAGGAYVAPVVDLS